MTALDQANALLQELGRRAGLDTLSLAPGSYTALQFDDVLVSLRLPESAGTLDLLATVEIPDGRESDILRDAMRDNGSAAECGAVLGFDETSRALTLRAAVPVINTAYPDFEKRLEAFVVLCEQWTERVSAIPVGATDLPPGGAIFA